jgi:DNA replication protein DnaC
MSGHLRIWAARFPQTKSLDTFDFNAQLSLNKALVLELARREWIEKRQNCIALEPSGTGKTPIGLTLGLVASGLNSLIGWGPNGANLSPSTGRP